MPNGKYKLILVEDSDDDVILFELALQAIKKHEDALVDLGFLRQEKLPAQVVSACPQTLETLDALRGECPWYHAETISTNLVLTACPGMMDRWRKRAKELGW